MQAFPVNGRDHREPVVHHPQRQSMVQYPVESAPVLPEKTRQIHLRDRRSDPNSAPPPPLPARSNSNGSSSHKVEDLDAVAAQLARLGAPSVRGSLGNLAKGNSVFIMTFHWINQSINQSFCCLKSILWSFFRGRKLTQPVNQVFACWKLRCKFSRFLPRRFS